MDATLIPFFFLFSLITAWNNQLTQQGKQKNLLDFFFFFLSAVALSPAQRLGLGKHQSALS